MRELSQSEKYVVNLIIERDNLIKKNPDNQHELSITDIFKGIANRLETKYIITIEKNQEEVTLLSSRIGDETIDLAKLHTFRREFVNAVHFIEYLKSEKFIYVFPEDLYIVNETLEFPIKFKEGSWATTITDKNFLSLLKSYFGNVLIPTEALINFHKRRYRTPEDLRFEKAMRVSYIAAFLAVCALLVTIVVGLIQIQIAINPNFCS